MSDPKRARHMLRRNMLSTIMILALAEFAGTVPAQAQTTDVRFVLDFLLQGQQSAFVLGRERGYYTAQKVNLTAFDPGRGGADSITKVASGTHDIGFPTAWVMTAVPSLIGLGVKRDDINVMMLRDHGLDLYANAVFTTPAFAKQHPDAVRGFVKATVQSWQNAAADPDAAVAALKRAEPLSDPAVEIVRLKAALEFVVTPGVRQTGIGHVDAARLAKHIEIVTDGFQLPRKLSPEMVFDSSFLPAAAERRMAN